MTNKTSAPVTSAKLFARVLKLGASLIAAIAIVGGAVGFVIAGGNGLASALIGAAMAMIFVSLTAASILIGGKLPLAGFFGVVMGGWILKLVGFIVVVGALKGADFINGPVLFFTIVASVLGSLILDAVIVTRAKIPTYQN